MALATQDSKGVLFAKSRTLVSILILEKVGFLQAKFYLTIEVDLTNIEDFSFSRESFLPNLIEVNWKAIREEVELILKSRKLFKALGIDGIPNSIL